MVRVGAALIARMVAVSVTSSEASAGGLPIALTNPEVASMDRMGAFPVALTVPVSGTSADAMAGALPSALAAPDGVASDEVMTGALPAALIEPPAGASANESAGALPTAVAAPPSGTCNWVGIIACGTFPTAEMLPLVGAMTLVDAGCAPTADASPLPWMRVVMRAGMLPAAETSPGVTTFVLSAVGAFPVAEMLPVGGVSVAAADPLTAMVLKIFGWLAENTQEPGSSDDAVAVLRALYCCAPFVVEPLLVVTESEYPEGAEVRVVAELVATTAIHRLSADPHDGVRPVESGAAVVVVLGVAASTPPEISPCQPLMRKH